MLAAMLVLATEKIDRRVDVCEVGRVALGDVPRLNHNPQYEAFVDAADPLLRACPNLWRALPAGYPLSTLDATKRATSHVPLPGRPVKLAALYYVGLPRSSPDRREATFAMGYTCTGLFGATFVARYRRTSTGWRRDGEIGLTTVS